MKTINLLLIALALMMFISCEPEEELEPEILEVLTEQEKDTSKENSNNRDKADPDEIEEKTDNPDVVRYNCTFAYGLSKDLNKHSHGINSVELTDERIVIIMDLRDENEGPIIYSDFDYKVDVTYHDFDNGIVEGVISWDGDDSKGLEKAGDTGEFRYVHNESFTLDATVSSGESSNIYLYN